MVLSDLKIKNAKPKHKAYKLSDEKGLYLYISVTGSKSWRFDYSYNGKRKTLSLGQYPDTSLVIARQKRDHARQLLASSPSCDPAMHFSVGRLNLPTFHHKTFEEAARE